MNVKDIGKPSDPGLGIEMVCDETVQDVYREVASSPADSYIPHDPVRGATQPIKGVESRTLKQYLNDEVPAVDPINILSQGAALTGVDVDEKNTESGLILGRFKPDYYLRYHEEIVLHGVHLKAVCSDLVYLGKFVDNILMRRTQTFEEYVEVNIFNRLRQPCLMERVQAIFTLWHMQSEDVYPVLYCQLLYELKECIEHKCSHVKLNFESKDKRVYMRVPTYNGIRWYEITNSKPSDVRLQEYGLTITQAKKLYRLGCSELPLAEMLGTEIVLSIRRNSRALVPEHVRKENRFIERTFSYPTEYTHMERLSKCKRKFEASFDADIPGMMENMPDMVNEDREACFLNYYSTQTQFYALVKRLTQQGENVIHSYVPHTFTRFTKVDEIKQALRELQTELGKINPIAQGNFIMRAVDDRPGLRKIVDKFKELCGDAEAQIRKMINLLPGFEEVGDKVYGFFKSVIDFLRETGAKFDLASILVDFIIFIYRLCTCQGKLDFAVSSFSFLRALHTEASNFCMKYVHKFLRVRRFEDFSFIDSWKKFFEKVLNHELVTNAKKIFLGLISMKVFGKDMSSKLKYFCGGGKGASVLTLVVESVGMIFTMMRVGDLLWKGLPFSKALFSDDPVTTYVAEGKALLNYEDCLYDGLPIKGRKERFEFMAECSTFIKNFELLNKSLDMKQEKNRDYQALYLKIQKALSSQELALQAQGRHAPIGIRISGPPGIGKMSMVQHIMKIYAKAKGIEYHKSAMYNQPIGTDFFDGYDPWQHWCMFFSEVGNKATPLAKTQGEERILPVCSIMDNLEFNCNMARLELKGKVKAVPQLVIIDTNTMDFGAEHTLNNSAALHRRFYDVVMEVKPEYRLGNYGMLDPAKSLADLDALMNRWNIRLYKNIAITKSEWTQQPIPGYPGGMDIYSLTEALHTIFIDHISKQSQVVSRIDNDISIDEYLLRARPEYLRTLPIEQFEREELKKRIDETTAWLDMDTSLYSEDEKEVALHFESYLHCEIGIGNPFTYVRKKIARWAISLLDTDEVEALTDVVNSFINVTLLYLLMFTLERVSDHVKTRVTRMRKRIATFRQMIIIMCLLAMYKYGLVALLVAILIIIMNDYIEKYLYYSLLADLRDRTELAKHEFTMSLVMVKYYFIKGYNPFHSKWWMAYGERAKTIMEAAAVVTGGVMVYKAYTKKNAKTLEMESTKFAFFSPDNDKLNAIEDEMETANPLPRVRNKLTNNWTTVEVNPVKTVHTEDSKSLWDSVKFNIIPVKIEACDEKDEIAYTNVFGVSNSLALINFHAISKWKKVTIRVPCNREINSNTTAYHDTVVYPGELNVVNGDVTIVHLNKVRFTNVKKHFLSEKVRIDSTGYFEGTKLHVETHGKVVMPYGSQDLVTIDNAVRYNFASHRTGLCGSPVICDFKGSCIVGIHAIGTTGDPECFAPIVTQGDIEYMSRAFESTFILNSQGTDFPEMIELHSRSPFWYEDLQGIRPLGSIPESRNVNSRSRVTKTPFHKEVSDLLADLGFIQTKFFTQPLMKHGKVNGIELRPVNRNLKTLAHGSIGLDPHILKKCEDHLYKKIVKSFKKNGVVLKPVDLDVVINGSHDDPAFRSMNLNTSGGFNFPGKKKQYVDEIRTDEYVYKELKSDLKARIVKLYDILDSGDSLNFVTKCTLKDEPVSIQKKESGRTRLFGAGSLDSLIINRQMLMPFYVNFVTHGTDFHSAVGINIYTGAEFLYWSMRKFKKKADGDFETWDMRIPFDIRRIAYNIVMRVCKKFGYNPMAMIRLYGVLCERLMPYIKVETDVISAPGYLASGLYGTAEDNTMCQILVSLYYWYSHPVLKNMNFDDYCVLWAYGDDGTWAVDEAIEPFINFFLLQKFYDMFMGMRYTDSAKTGNEQAFTSTLTVSFLKRELIFKDGRVKPQLDINSIFRSLQWYIPSDVATLTEQTRGSFTASVIEMYLYLNTETFEKYRDGLREIYQKHFLCDPRLPTYEEVGSYHGVD